MVTEQEVEAIGKTLVDPGQPLQTRFRALFTLRGLGGPHAIAWISRAFEDSSALLKHELAYCLGQMQDPRAIPVLADVLRDAGQEPMVRHEAGEALGAIGDPEVLDLLKQYSTDPVVEVAETCQLAVGRLEWLQQHPGEDSAFRDPLLRLPSPGPGFCGPCPGLPAWPHGDSTSCAHDPGLGDQAAVRPPHRPPWVLVHSAPDRHTAAWKLPDVGEHWGPRGPRIVWMVALLRALPGRGPHRQSPPLPGPLEGRLKLIHKAQRPGLSRPHPLLP
nr:deoxyhypusine hydroxylase [Peromyscus maniculatus bairdii]